MYFPFILCLLQVITLKCVTAYPQKDCIVAYVSIEDFAYLPSMGLEATPIPYYGGLMVYTDPREIEGRYLEEVWSPVPYYVQPIGPATFGGYQSYGSYSSLPTSVVVNSQPQLSTITAVSASESLASVSTLPAITGIETATASAAAVSTSPAITGIETATASAAAISTSPAISGIETATASAAAISTSPAITGIETATASAAAVSTSPAISGIETATASATAVSTSPAITGIETATASSATVSTTSAPFTTETASFASAGVNEISNVAGNYIDVRSNSLVETTPYIVPVARPPYFGGVVPACGNVKIYANFR